MSGFTANSYLVCFLLYVGSRNEALSEVSLDHDGGPDDIDFVNAELKRQQRLDALARRISILDSDGNEVPNHDDVVDAIVFLFTNPEIF